MDWKTWGPGLLDLGWRLVLALIIIFVGTRLVRLVRRILKKTFDRTELDASVSRFLLAAAEAGVYALTIFIAADQLGVPSASIIALLGSAGLAIGMSLQGSLANVAGGILILLMRPFRVGDYVIYQDMEGTVEAIGLVYTTIVTVDNRKVTVPNGSISNAPVINTTAQEKRRVEVDVRIGYGESLQAAKEAVRAVYEAQPKILKEDGIAVYVGDLGESSLTLCGRGWVKTPDYWDTRCAVLEEVKLGLDRAGIRIAPPQMEVTVRPPSSGGGNAR